MTTATEPPVWPSLPWLSLVGLAIALAPGWLTPDPPQASP
jgi:hypothetical protein